MKNFKVFYPPLREGDKGYVSEEDWEGCECPSDCPWDAEEVPFLCTLRRGHKLPHAAHGSQGVLYATWEDDE